MKIYSFSVNTIKLSSSVMKTFKFSLMLRIHENTDVFITLDENIYGIYNKRVNILYMSFLNDTKNFSVSFRDCTVFSVAGGRQLNCLLPFQYGLLRVRINLVDFLGS